MIIINRVVGCLLVYLFISLGWFVDFVRIINRDIDRINRGAIENQPQKVQALLVNVLIKNQSWSQNINIDHAGNK